MGDAKLRSDDASHGEKGVAEFRSSVIRFNGEIASPARRRKEGEKEIRSCWVGRGEAGVYIQTCTGAYSDRWR
jgi:hypothetical protein